jgi:alkylation response protein AidB-like acyl-CoA dehydrogenase
MDFRFTPEQDEWRREVRSTIDSLITSDLREEMESDDDVGPGPAGKHFMRELGSRGLLGISWPEEYGGLGRSLMDQYIFSEEIGGYGGLYTNGTAVNMVGPTIMNVGNDEQRAEWLPKMLSGEVECALGYTEPGAGTDLAGLQTRAVVDGDDYVINGQKLFTSAGHFSSHVWLLARTDTEVRKHRGLSVFLVPMDSDGISVRPLWRMDSGRTNEVFFDNVRIPRQNLIGEPNRGWYHVAMALDFERVSIGSRYTGLMRRLNKLVAYANKTEVDGEPLSRDPHFRTRFAEIGMKLETVRLLSYRTAWMIDQGIVPNYESSALKIVATDLIQEVADFGFELLGLYGQLTKNSPFKLLDGEMEQAYRSGIFLRFGGGANEVQRNIIAQRGLGMPREGAEPRQDLRSPQAAAGRT